jgi:hypothetical protein
MALIISQRVFTDVLLLTIIVVWSERFLMILVPQQPIAELFHLDAAAHFTQ